MSLTDEQMWKLWNAQGSDFMDQKEAIAFARAATAPLLKRIAELEQRNSDLYEDLHRLAALVRNAVLEEAAKVADEKYQEMASKGFPREASTARALAKTYRSIKQNL